MDDKAEENQQLQRFVFFACCLILICHSPLNCSNQITNFPSLLIHISHIPVRILLAFASRHKARSLGFQMFCSVGGMGPPSLYSHRLCFTNSMLHSSIGVHLFGSYLGFVYDFFHSVVNVSSWKVLLQKELLIFIELCMLKVIGIQIFMISL